MYEKKTDFGRCPICDAITSLDPEKNQLCDRCYGDIKRQNDADDSARMLMNSLRLSYYKVGDIY